MTQCANATHRTPPAGGPCPCGAVTRVVAAPRQTIEVHDYPQDASKPTGLSRWLRLGALEVLLADAEGAR